VGIGDVVLVVLTLAGYINSATTLDLFLPTPTSGDRPFYGACTVERRDGPCWLRDDDDDDDDDVLYGCVALIDR